MEITLVRKDSGRAQKDAVVCRTMSGSVSAAGLATSADNSTEEILGADFFLIFVGKVCPKLIPKHSSGIQHSPPLLWKKS